METFFFLITYWNLKIYLILLHIVLTGEVVIL